MRACFLWGVMALATGVVTSALAQQTNSPLYPSGAGVVPPYGTPMPSYIPHHPPQYVPQYVPPSRYPTDSRNPTLDNRAPTLGPVAPDSRDRTPHFGPPLENGAVGPGLRRSEGLRPPGLPAQARPPPR